jgi:hypothetical protein
VGETGYARRIPTPGRERDGMLRLHRLPRGRIRVLLLGVFVAIAAASAASSLSSAAVTSCSGLGIVAGSSDISYGTCATDQNDGDGSVDFSRDGRTMALDAKTRQGSEQVAGFWQSNGPITVTATRICVAINVTSLKVKGIGAVEQQLILSHDGVQEDALTWSVTATGIQPAYCGTVPTGATNVWWQLISLAGGSKVRVHETLVTVGYST